MDAIHHRVVIIGGGPAGVACALSLRDLGETDVFLADRFTFPRYKCCAGYVTRKTKEVYESFGLSPEKDCHYSLIEDFMICLQTKPVRRIPNRFLYTNRMIDRTELDGAFFRLASSRGILCGEGFNLVAHDIKENLLTFSNGERMTYDHLVFADGAFGFSSRYQKKNSRNIAMQAVFERPGETDRIRIHFGMAPRGYGWESVCGGVINLGLTDLFSPKEDYRALFRAYVEKLGFSPDGGELKAAYCPRGIRKPVLFGNVYFIGDALGACDPLTMSGIRYGLKSAKKAAESIVRGTKTHLKAYAWTLRVRFGAMCILQRLFYTRPVCFLVFRVGCGAFGGVVDFFFQRFLNHK